MQSSSPSGQRVGNATPGNGRKRGRARRGGKRRLAGEKRNGREGPEAAGQHHNPRVGGSSPSSGMKYLQIATFSEDRTRGFRVRRKVRVLKTAKSVPSGAVDNTRILDAPTHGRAQPPAHGALAERHRRDRRGAAAFTRREARALASERVAPHEKGGLRFPPQRPTIGQPQVGRASAPTVRGALTPGTPQPDSPRRFGTFRSAATAVGVSEPYVLVGLILFALALGGIVHIFEPGRSGDLIWAAAIILTLIPLTWSVLRTLMHGDVGVDAIALVAMVGALALGEYLAGAVIALMLSGGNALEAAAGRRARRELTALLERAPRIAHRRQGEKIEEVRSGRSRSETGSWSAPARSSRSMERYRASGP